MAQIGNRDVHAVQVCTYACPPCICLCACSVISQLRLSIRICQQGKYVKHVAKTKTKTKQKQKPGTHNC